MITNERQYKITRSEADRFRKAIGDLAKDPTRTDVHPRLIQAEREAMESQLADLQAELAEYDRLKSADLSVISINSFDELADGLIKARIAQNIMARYREICSHIEAGNEQIRAESHAAHQGNLGMREVADSAALLPPNDY